MQLLRIKVNSPIFVNFDHKICCYANDCWAIEKGVKSVIYDQIPTIWWKFGEKKKNKLTQAEHIAGGSRMTRGPNKDETTSDML